MSREKEEGMPESRSLTELQELYDGVMAQAETLRIDLKLYESDQGRIATASALSALCAYATLLGQRIKAAQDEEAASESVKMRLGRYDVF